MKGYKITDNQRSHRYGIGANSLAMLKEKARKKFPLTDLCVYLASNGFEVADEDYFETLEPQTLFIVGAPDEIITIDEEFNYEKSRIPLIKASEIITRYMEQHPGKFRRMIEAYECINSSREEDNSDRLRVLKTHLSLKAEHSEWFVGTHDERCKSKEEAMARRAQDRIRSYYYKTKDELTRTRLYRSNLQACKIIDETLRKFRYLLIGCDYFSMMFNRKFPKKHSSLSLSPSDDETDAHAIPNKRLRQVIKRYTAQHEIFDEWSVSLCNDLGQFFCQGAYSAPTSDSCTKQHTINPYVSRENLILFQVWNLDHQIELCRSILPGLLESVRKLIEQPNMKCIVHKRRVVDISVLEYFLEIFSLKNLKLVHIVCHDKSQRSNKSKGRLLCKECEEYRLVEELMSVRCEEADDETDAF